MFFYDTYFTPSGAHLRHGGAMALRWGCRGNAVIARRLRGKQKVTQAMLKVKQRQRKREPAAAAAAAAVVAAASSSSFGPCATTPPRRPAPPSPPSPLHACGSRVSYVLKCVTDENENLRALLKGREERLASEKSVKEDFTPLVERKARAKFYPPVRPYLRR